jgi:hypothetical protein
MNNELERNMIKSGLTEKKVKEFFLSHHKGSMEFYEREMNNKNNSIMKKMLAKEHYDFHKKRYNEELDKLNALNSVGEKK